MGKDYIYKDNLTIEEKIYLQQSAQLDEYDNRLFSNTESNGRFHSDWLSFIYPRLKLARNLLSDDGIIFIQIDENEQHNLRKICDEIFGAENFIGDIIRKTKSQTNDAKNGLNYQQDFVLIYARDKNKACLIGPEKDISNYKNPDNDPMGDWIIDNPSARSGGENSRFPIKNPYTGWEDLPPKGRYWAFSRETFAKWVKSGKIKFRENYKETERGFIVKKYLSELKSDYKLVDSLFGVDNSYMNQVATKEQNEIFGDSLFSYPKPLAFIKRIVESIENKGQKSFIVMDFFAGSGTTAQAVMQLNAEDGGRRKFILVQLPEEVDEKSEAAKAGFRDIAEICKERIRRAGQMIKTGKYADDRPVRNWQPPENPDLDIGFRVFKIDSSNMREDYYRLPQETIQAELRDKADNIKPGRSPEDLLFQLFLEWGVPLSSCIEKEEIDGRQVFFVNKAEFESIQTDMIACFGKDLTESLLIKLAQLKPLRAVFRDHGFATDSTRENLEGIFKQITPQTDLRVI